MATWTFVRHGQSVANLAGWFAGHIDTELTDHGIDQARDVSKALANKTFGATYSSDLIRAIDTAKVILESHPNTLQCDAALRERDAGEWEYASRKVLRAQGEMARLTSWHDAPPGGESLQALMLRVLPFLANLDHQVPTLIVAHGGVIRGVIGLYDNLPLAEIGLCKIKNVEVIEREIGPTTWTSLLAKLR